MVEIRNMTQAHAEEVLEMMRVFYASPAVSTNGSEEIFRNDVENCVNESPYLEGYVFCSSECSSENASLLGYAMVAKSFSTEFGRPCIWIEDLYFKPEYRGKGIGTRFFAHLEEKYPGAILRLEVEEENERAIHVYRKNGFDELPYMEMKKLL